MKEDEINMFIIKYAQRQLKGKRKGEAKERGRGGEGESTIILLEGQLSSSIPA